MERIVKHITKRLVNEIPAEQETCKLSDLHSSGIPRFVVRRIEVELERNLAESIVLPETEWADMESEAVREAWDQFVSAIRAQARLPQSYSYAVLETAVSDIVDILVQPRKNLPDVIFGAAEELAYKEVVDRMDAIVVYRHFASLIPRYMEKKGLKSLTKARCTNIITQADEKLTARYTPLNWAQMLEPLFILVEEQIDSNLLRLFFEDKNKPRLARQFDLMNQSLNRSELIELLSSPDLPDEGDEQNELFAPKASPPKRPDVTSGWEGLVRPAEMDAHEKEEPEIKQLQKEQPGEDQNVLAQFYDEEEEDDTKEYAEQEESETDKDSLNELFWGEESNEVEETAEREQHKEDEEEETPSVDEQENQEESVDPDIEEQIFGTQPESSSKNLDAEDEDEAEAEEEEAADPENEEQQPPMWQKFMSSHDLDESEDELETEEPEPEEEREEVEEEEPLIDLTEEKNEAPDSKRVQQLRKELRNDRDRFVEDIFRGADEAYEQALEEIAAKDDWRSASRFIERDIFKRNLVDMYSESAVDFTDRLHSYFTEAENAN